MYPGIKIEFDINSFGLSTWSMKQYAGHIQAFEQWVTENFKRVQSINPTHVRGYFEFLIGQGKGT